MPNFKENLKDFLKPENKIELEGFIDSKLSESDAERTISYLSKFLDSDFIPEVSEILITPEGDFSVKVETGRTFRK